MFYRDPGSLDGGFAQKDLFIRYDVVLPIYVHKLKNILHSWKSSQMNYNGLGYAPVADLVEAMGV